MEETTKYQPEYNLLQDTYLGSKDSLQKKIIILIRYGSKRNLGL